MNRPIKLGERTFEVPPFVLKHNMAIYPLCRRLSNNGMIDRFMKAGAADFTADDMAELADIAFLSAAAAVPISRDEFEALTVTPAELFDAFLVARYQTGGWIATDAASATATDASGDAAGEAQGEARPPLSTSTASSPA